jgi:hypothetical protein
MGKGSKHISLRMKPELWQKLDATLARANRHATRKSPAEPYTLRTWIARAIADKLEHLERARRQRARKRKVRHASGPVEQDLTKSVRICESGTGVVASFSEQLVESNGVAVEPETAEVAA